MKGLRSDTGAAAVEFALIMVPLLLILFGIIDFGHAYNQNLSLSSAAREGVRVMAIQNDPAIARKTVRDAAPQLSPALTDSQITIFPLTCTSGATVTVTVTYPLISMTGMFDPLFRGEHLTGVGVMKCGG